MCAIVAALQSDLISRLDVTHQAMSNKEHRRYQKLATFFKKEDNYSAYRAAVRLNDNRGCIPWHGTLVRSLTSWWANCFGPIEAHLHDIGNVLQEERDVEEHYGGPLVNFEKWTHLKEKAVDVMRHRDTNPEYNEDGLETSMAYLEQQLQPIAIDDDFSRLLQTKSDRLRQDEEEIRSDKVLLLVGFV
jgi:hypothetical protein